MLSQLDLRNEWRLLVRYPLLWIVLAATGGFSLLIASGSPAEPGSDPVAALLRLNLFVPAFILPFLAGALGPIFYLREVDHGMSEMLGSYPLTARQWLAKRFGSFAVLLVAACLLAQLVFLTVLALEHPGAWSRMSAHTALWLLVLHMPSCLIWASALAWLSCRNAHAGFVYFAAGLGWLSYLGLATMTGTPLISGSMTAWLPLKHAMIVLDPHAATAMVNPMPEEGWLRWRWLNVALGRMFWLVICFMLLRGIKEVPARAERALGNHDGQAHDRDASKAGAARMSHVRIHLRYFVSDRVFPLLLLGWIALLLPEAYGGMGYAEPMSRIVPDSRDALNRVVWDVLPVAGALLLLYATDRICRLYPATRMHELYAATTHRSISLLTVQLVTVWIVAGLFTMLAGLSVLLAQLLARSPLQPYEYLLQLGLTFPRLVLFPVLFVAVHGLIRQRFAANLACLLLLVLGFSSLAPSLGLHHPLWKPLDTPLVQPDHYWGFAGGIAGHFGYLFFWMPVALSVLLLAVAVRNRTLPTAQVRLSNIVRHPAAVVAAICIGAAALQGGAISRTLRQEGALVTPDERTQRRADYERNYAHWTNIAQPDIEAIRAWIDFYPRMNRVRMRVDIRLLNRSDRPIMQVLVGRNQLGGSGEATLEHASVLRRDARLGQTVFQLNRPLAPGQSLELGFTANLVQSGLEPGAFPLVLRREFSSLPAYAVLPVIGFKRELTLRDPGLRKEHGLPPLVLRPPSKLGAATLGSLKRHKVLLESVVSTDQDQHNVAQGHMVKQWLSNGRSYAHYLSDEPIRNLPAFFSVPWRQQTWHARQFQIDIYSPTPLTADDSNALAMRDTLVWLDSEVARYPGTALRLLAVPETGPSGYALPQVLQISHRLGFRAMPEAGSGFNQIYRRAAHETAHQWFGHLLGYGVLEERAFLVESLAKYAELVMIEQRYGRRAMHALVDFERDRYRQARLDPTQAVAPLIDAEESEDMYSRATLAFACLRKKVGDDPIMTALRKLADDQVKYDRPATSRDFIRALRSASPADAAAAIDELFVSTKPIREVEHRMGCDQ